MFPLAPDLELHDVLGVAVGIALGLLTVYRRELSCNRGYHPDCSEDGDGDQFGDSLPQAQGQGGAVLHVGEDVMSHARHGRIFSSPSLGDVNCTNNSQHGIIRRRKSVPSFNSVMCSYHDGDGDRRANNGEKSNVDTTEALLESAGLFLSGGVFLAMAIAVFDHLFLTMFIRIVEKIVSLRHKIRTDISPGNTAARDEDAMLGGISSRPSQPSTRHHHVYSVAWHAATEYFTNCDSASNHVQSSENPRLSLSQYPRSKSTGNLPMHLSDARSRMLLREMVAMSNSGYMDVTMLPSDAQIVVFSYLPPQDVLAFTCTGRAGRILLEEDADLHLSESVDMAANQSGAKTTESKTAMLIWKALFQRDYSWVLSDWKIGSEAFMRSMQHYEREELPSLCSKGYELFWHLASTILDRDRDVNGYSHLVASSSAWIHPTSSMKDFYFIFAETWLNYTIAGCNTVEKCFIGLHGHVFDISDFVEDHPGSTETLLLQAGRDATVFFESMGHSLGARKLALKMCAVVNGKSARWHFTEGERSCSSFHMRAGPLGPLFSTCGLIKPTSKSLDVKRDIVGFLIPRKRSRPRYQGGLRRVHDRIMQEEELQLVNAERWGGETLGPDGLFGGVHVYHDPFLGWMWWYTDRDFNVIFVDPPS